MTQLVELQRVLPRLEAAGYCLYAISYDTQEQLRNFASQYGIAYALLSDLGSAVIRRFGILNTLILPDERGHRWYGIPFPGTYVTDEIGVVARKFFNQHHAMRESGETILDQLLGRVFDGRASPRVAVSDDNIDVSIFLREPDLKLEVASTVYCRIALPYGVHIYAEPVSDGFVATRVEIPPTRGLRIGAAVYPASETYDMAALGMRFNVFTATVDIAIPVTVTSELLKLGHPRDIDSIRIDVNINYQACNDTMCSPPRMLQTGFEAPLGDLILPEGIEVYVERLRKVSQKP
jgi:peroxiredoxin